jgi:hypothetical protein
MSIAAAAGIATSAPIRPSAAPPISTDTIVTVAGTVRSQRDERHDGHRGAGRAEEPDHER